MRVPCPRLCVGMGSSNRGRRQPQPGLNPPCPRKAVGMAPACNGMRDRIVVWLYVGLGVAAVVLFLAAMWWVGKRAGQSTQLAQTQFVRQREHLEADFLRAAQASGKPRGLTWVECDWTREIEWGRDRKTGQLLALVGMTIRFEAVPGSDME